MKQHVLIRAANKAKAWKGPPKRCTITPRARRLLAPPILAPEVATAIYVSTSDASVLLQAIYEAIDQKHVRTWRYQDSDNIRFLTHTTSDNQWDAKAWLTGTVGQNLLTFNIRHPPGEQVTWPLFAAYHGRFIEMLIEHFHDRFAYAHATSSVVDGDTVQDPAAS